MLRSLMHLTMFLLASPLLAQSLTEALTKDPSKFSNLERGLILCGADTQQALDESLADFERFLKKVELTKKQRSLPGNRQMRALFKNLGKALKTEDGSASIQDAMKDGKYHPVIASFLTEEVAVRMDLGEQTWQEDPRPADPHFAKSSPNRADAVGAVLYMLAAEKVFASNPELCEDLIHLSHELDKNLTYDSERLSREWYNRIYKLYQEEKWVLGGRLAAPTAARFPSRHEFPPLCFNFGVLISQKDDMPILERKALMKALVPYAGEHRESLEQTITSLAYNQAVRRYKNGDYREAWAMAKDLKHTDTEALKQLQAAILENLIQNAETGQEKSNFLKALTQVDAQAAKRFQTRMDQLAVKTQFEDGDYESALELAAQQLDSAQGKNNYLAVLQKLIGSLNESGKFGQALHRLGSIPASHVPKDTIADMRYNTYLTWLNKEQDLSKQIPIYQKMDGDKMLGLDAQERQSLMDNWANAYQLLIEDKIAQREFKLAEDLCAKAIESFPNHEGLKTQEKLIQTIMTRLKNEQ